jgi:hypothetical protein
MPPLERVLGERSFALTPSQLSYPEIDFDALGQLNTDELCIEATAQLSTEDRATRIQPPISTATPPLFTAVTPLSDHILSAIINTIPAGRFSAYNFELLDHEARESLPSSLGNTRIRLAKSTVGSAKLPPREVPSNPTHSSSLIPVNYSLDSHACPADEVTIIDSPASVTLAPAASTPPSSPSVPRALPPVPAAQASVLPATTAPISKPDFSATSLLLPAFHQAPISPPASATHANVSSLAPSAQVKNQTNSELFFPTVDPEFVQSQAFVSARGAALAAAFVPFPRQFHRQTSPMSRF